MMYVSKLNKCIVYVEYNGYVYSMLEECGLRG